MPKYNIELHCVAHLQIEAKSREEALELFGEGPNQFQLSGQYIKTREVINIELDRIGNIEEVKSL